MESDVSFQVLTIINCLKKLKSDNLVGVIGTTVARLAVDFFNPLPALALQGHDTWRLGNHWQLLQALLDRDCPPEAKRPLPRRMRCREKWTAFSSSSKAGPWSLIGP